MTIYFLCSINHQDKRPLDRRVRTGKVYGIKGIWNILNRTIRNKSRHVNYPQYFIDNGEIIYNMNEVANRQVSDGRVRAGV